MKNTDSKCFLWSVLAALYPDARNPDRLSDYVDYENILDISGLSFPLAVKDVPKFEKQNPSISVNVMCSGDKGGYFPIYVSKERDRLHHVNLERTKASATCSVLFFSRPRSEDWPHNGRTFSIYPCPLSF